MAEVSTIGMEFAMKLNQLVNETIAQNEVSYAEISGYLSITKALVDNNAIKLATEYAQRQNQTEQ